MAEPEVESNGEVSQTPAIVDKSQVGPRQKPVLNSGTNGSDYRRLSRVALDRKRRMNEAELAESRAKIEESQAKQEEAQAKQEAARAKQEKSRALQERIRIEAGTERPKVMR